MLETHPFGIFVPKNAKYLLLGSFTTKEANDASKTYEWFYSNGRNQFWPIMEAVYGMKFQSKEEMQRLFTNLNMVMADIIYQCERKNNSNLDMNLTNIVYAVDDLTNVLGKNSITKIFFTSRYVENLFKRIFKTKMQEWSEIEMVTLPSPSPRYAQMTKQQKIDRYKELLPMLE